MDLTLVSGAIALLTFVGVAAPQYFPGVSIINTSELSDNRWRFGWYKPRGAKQHIVLLGIPLGRHYGQNS